MTERPSPRTRRLIQSFDVFCCTIFQRTEPLSANPFVPWPLQERFARNATLEFTRDRKMMSVLVAGDARQVLFCKVRRWHGLAWRGEGRFAGAGSHL